MKKMFTLAMMMVMTVTIYSSKSQWQHHGYDNKQ